MTKYYYRGMRDENGKPKLARNARCLGIRPGIDIDIETRPEGWLDKQNYLLPKLEQKDSRLEVELAIANGKGMSISLSIAGLPKHRKPPKFGGTGRDPIWEIDSSFIKGDLKAIEDGGSHVSLVPRQTMLLARYEDALAQTRNNWIKVN